jgi:DNA-binding Lrp family transcriptional regulator
VTAKQFTDNDLWNELDEYFRIEPRQPGDVTINEIAEHYGISDETARVKMKTLTKGGVYRYVKVAVDGKVIGVYRKVQAGA